ncbi:SMI1/KNR4 family protein [Flavobacterium nackdongense]|uniref:SMI1/KNR4 family protein n=1 Tax=Flavobacterium nackdongense TaxID=2547394 RepID=A0A4V1AGY7_9FLAO|nr:SMI1/KNR4 family protein [Flavobacterium nackdongense]QBN19682.1 SMI1/KNR4 family protein [Flavobacterium nackdongense]
MNSFEEVKKELYKYENLGIEKFENGTILIGKALHIAPLAWLNKIYPVLNEDDILLIENELKTEVPLDYKNFLINFSNGLNIFVATFSLYGLRKVLGRSVEASRQPFSIFTPNSFERPENSKDHYFFIGGYNWDGSNLYIDKQTNKVHYCDRWDATSLFEWNSFDEMIVSEVKRITNLFDEKGVVLDENKYTTPIEIK